MRRRWRDVLIDWMNGLATHIECLNARRRWEREVRRELIVMDCEDKIRRMGEACRRVAARHRDPMQYP